MYHLDLYIRQDKVSWQEVAKFINPLRNYKRYNKDSNLFTSDYRRGYDITQIINLISSYIESHISDIKNNLIFVVSKSSIDCSFNDGINPNDKVKRKQGVPQGMKLKTLFTVRYDFVSNFWYLMPEPNDEGKWAGGFSHNPYDRWENCQEKIISKYKDGVL